MPLNVFEVRGIKQSTKKEPKKQKYLKTKQTARTHACTYTRTYIHTFTKSRGYLDIKNCSTHKNNDTHLKEPVLIRQIYIKTICVKGWKFHPGTWLPVHNVWTRGRPQMFTWIRHGDRIFQDVGICTEKLAVVHFSSWNFVLHTVSSN